jgi:hypothetical protein
VDGFAHLIEDIAKVTVAVTALIRAINGVLRAARKRWR